MLHTCLFPPTGSDSWSGHRNERENERWGKRQKFHSKKDKKYFSMSFLSLFTNSYPIVPFDNRLLDLGKWKPSLPTRLFSYFFPFHSSFFSSLSGHKASDPPLFTLFSISLSVSVGFSMGKFFVFIFSHDLLASLPKAKENRSKRVQAAICISASLLFSSISIRILGSRSETRQEASRVMGFKLFVSRKQADPSSRLLFSAETKRQRNSPMWLVLPSVCLLSTSWTREADADRRDFSRKTNCFEGKRPFTCLSVYVKSKGLEK